MNERNFEIINNFLNFFRLGAAVVFFFSRCKTLNESNSINVNINTNDFCLIRQVNRRASILSWTELTDLEGISEKKWNNWWEFSENGFLQIWLETFISCLLDLRAAWPDGISIYVVVVLPIIRDVFGTVFSNTST